MSYGYPGVYLNKLASPSTAITAATTAVTAFVGLALRGPINEPTTINSFTDFQRIFGGLWLDNPLGYAVQDFFLNGGTQAVIVRIIPNFELLSSAGIAATCTISDTSNPADTLTLATMRSGTWANNSNLTAQVTAANHIIDTYYLTLVITCETPDIVITYGNLVASANISNINRALCATPIITAQEPIGLPSDTLEKKPFSINEQGVYQCALPLANGNGDLILFASIADPTLTAKVTLDTSTSTFTLSIESEFYDTDILDDEGLPANVTTQIKYSGLTVTNITTALQATLFLKLQGPAQTFTTTTPSAVDFSGGIDGYYPAVGRFATIEVGDFYTFQVLETGTAGNNYAISITPNNNQPENVDIRLTKPNGDVLNSATFGTGSNGFNFSNGFAFGLDIVTHLFGDTNPIKQLIAMTNVDFLTLPALINNVQFTGGSTSTTATCTVPPTTTDDSIFLNLVAINPGSNGNNLKVAFDWNVSTEVAVNYNLQTTDLFNLIIIDAITGETESYQNLTVKDSPRRIDFVLQTFSNLIKVQQGSLLPEGIPLQIALSSQSCFVGGSGGGISFATSQFPTAGEGTYNFNIVPSSNNPNYVTLTVTPHDNTYSAVDIVVTDGAISYESLPLYPQGLQTHQQIQTFFTKSGAPVMLTLTGSPVTLPIPVNNAVVSVTADPAEFYSLASMPDNNSQALALRAVNPGSWGNNLQVEIDWNISPAAAVIYGVEVSDLFNLTVTDLETGVSEFYPNLTVKPGNQCITNVLQNLSDLIMVDPGESFPNNVIPLPTSIYAPYTVVLNNGSDGNNDNSFSLQAADITGNQANKTGLFSLDNSSGFNLLCIPDFTRLTSLNDLQAVLATAAEYCYEKRAFLIIDPLTNWTSTANAANTTLGTYGINDLIAATASYNQNAAVFFPRIMKPDPLANNAISSFVPCGAVAGTMARIDAQRGVWKAAAGLDASLSGITQLSLPLTDNDSGQLNPLGINCLRTFIGSGQVIWGSRTLQGSDAINSQWKYISVRRLALYIENSIYQSIQWAVFEPNDASLWQQLSLTINTFMGELFRQGAFQGTSASNAYFVTCDSTTTTQADIDQGIVNIAVGFAPVNPAEFIVINIQQLAGQTS